MIWREGKVSRLTLIGLAGFAVLVFALAEQTAKPERQPYFNLKLKAAKQALLAQEAVKEAAQAAGVAIDRENDPYATGLIGQERTPITSDRGVVTSKILATNPNFAAAFVELLLRAGVRKNDLVACGMTGSLPGWNISFYAACWAIGAHPLVITSVGSSDWGANLPTLTWLDMEDILVKRGIFSYRSAAASIGGGSDNGRGMSPEGRQLIRDAIKRNGVELIETDDVDSSILWRMHTYSRLAAKKEIDAYVNIGGGLASLGGSQNERLIPPGLSKHLAAKNFPVRGVINRMAERGLPVIHLLEVEKIAAEYGLPTVVTPERPELGEGPLFFKDKYSISSTVFLTTLLLLVLFIFIRLDVAHYLFRRRHPAAPQPSRAAP